MFRGMIRYGMRGSIPKNEQDSFVLLYQDEDVWKKLADFSDPNDAYITLVDSAGQHPMVHARKSPESAGGERSQRRNQ